MAVNRMSRIIHAYKQAPWRIQRQWIGAFLLGLLLLAMVAALYLNVTARAAIVGRRIQNLELEITANQRTNADLETQIATLLSTAEMERRAKALGFEPANPDEMEYLPVSGYIPPPAVRVGKLPQAKLYAPSTPPEYTQSLLDWFGIYMQTPLFPETGASK
jgi:hypothetical protein